MFSRLLAPETRLALETLQEEVRQCRRCSLCDTRTQTVFADGAPEARVMFIGEAPGEQEDLTGKPFVGRAGKLLTEMMAHVGLYRDTSASASVPPNVYIANTLKCRPPGNATPVPEQLQACGDYLLEQIRLVNPDVIVLVGSTAFYWLFQEKIPISKVRGLWMQSPKVRGHIMTVFHPSYLLRQHSLAENAPRALTLRDLHAVKTYLEQTP
ncbi:MAG: uracil-DNA glycosylase family protein [Vampirovibrionales bacterium]